MTHPAPPTFGLPTLPLRQKTWACALGIHPGPEDTCTTVPTGPFGGVSLIQASKSMLAVFEAPEVSPVAVRTWLPKYGCIFTVPDHVPTELVVTVATVVASRFSFTLSEAPNPVTVTGTMSPGLFSAGAVSTDFVV